MKPDKEFKKKLTSLLTKYGANADGGKEEIIKLYERAYKNGFRDGVKSASNKVSVK